MDRAHLLKIAGLAVRVLRTKDFGKDHNLTLELLREAISLTEIWIHHVEKEHGLHHEPGNNKSLQRKADGGALLGMLPKLVSTIWKVSRKSKDDEGPTTWKMKLVKEIHRSVKLAVMEAGKEVEKLERKGKGRRRRRRRFHVDGWVEEPREASSSRPSQLPDPSLRPSSRSERPQSTSNSGSGQRGPVIRVPYGQSQTASMPGVASNPGVKSRSSDSKRSRNTPPYPTAIDEADDVGVGPSTPRGASSTSSKSHSSRHSKRNDDARGPQSTEAVVDHAVQPPETGGHGSNSSLSKSNSNGSTKSSENRGGQEPRAPSSRHGSGPSHDSSKASRDQAKSHSSKRETSSQNPTEHGSRRPHHTGPDHKDKSDPDSERKENSPSVEERATSSRHGSGRSRTDQQPDGINSNSERSSKASPKGPPREGVRSPPTSSRHAGAGSKSDRPRKCHHTPPDDKCSSRADSSEMRSYGVVDGNGGRHVEAGGGPSMLGGLP